MYLVVIGDGTLDISLKCECDGESGGHEGVCMCLLGLAEKVAPFLEDGYRRDAVGVHLQRVFGVKDFSKIVLPPGKSLQVAVAAVPVLRLGDRVWGQRELCDSSWSVGAGGATVCDDVPGLVGDIPGSVGTGASVATGDPVVMDSVTPVVEKSGGSSVGVPLRRGPNYEKNQEKREKKKTFEEAKGRGGIWCFLWCAFRGSLCKQELA